MLLFMTINLETYPRGVSSHVIGPTSRILTWERWINPESCTPKREITLANLKEKQCRGNTLHCIITDRALCAT